MSQGGSPGNRLQCTAENLGSSENPRRGTRNKHERWVGADVITSVIELLSPFLL